MGGPVHHFVQFGLLVAVVAVAVAAQEIGDEVVVEGYLMDNLCIDQPWKLAPDNSNITHEPWEHTRVCNLLSFCKETGFGLVQDLDENGKWTVSYRLSEAAQAQFVEFLGTTSKSDDMFAEITGVISGFSDQYAYYSNQVEYRTEVDRPVPVIDVTTLFIDEGGVTTPTPTDSTTVAGSYCADSGCEDGAMDGGDVWCGKAEEYCTSSDCGGVWCPSETGTPDTMVPTPAPTNSPAPTPAPTGRRRGSDGTGVAVFSDDNSATSSSSSHFSNGTGVAVFSDDNSATSSSSSHFAISALCLLLALFQ